MQCFRDQFTNKKAFHTYTATIFGNSIDSAIFPGHTIKLCYLKSFKVCIKYSILHLLKDMMFFFETYDLPWLS